ncbi:MAG: hypothetical protein F6K35_22305 [Okeania sp. SIO2H7]|nr:hypothetical protein [Okeania sp. SIO2H7]
MPIKYLMDENLDPIYQKQLRQKEPNLVVWAVGDPNTPPKGTLDPDIWIWCEGYDFILVTNNPSSMPVHLKEHLTQGCHIPGIFQLNPNLTIGETRDKNSPFPISNSQ